ncbi:MAG: hypothetical protein GY861_28320 [bacterium]|nr:hypothetical protein [bacterium]
MKKVFLGGTCNGSTWREKLIPMLEIDYFNPVVDDWTPECQAEEIRQRDSCDLCLYVITSEMTGAYSIAEVVQDSYVKPEKTVFCFLYEGFSVTQIKSLQAVGRLVERNGSKVCFTLIEVAEHLSKFQEKDKTYDPNLIECTTKRPDGGPLQVTKDAYSYMFEYNDDGDCVCPVSNTGHRIWFLKQSSFRIYRENDQPEKEFTEEEEAWISTWLHKGPNNFLSFVNSNTHEFINSKPAIRKIAHEKWKSLLPQFETCPFIRDNMGDIPRRQMEPETIPVKEQAVSPKALSHEISKDDFQKRINPLKKSSYNKFIDLNEEFFMTCSDEIEEIAITKWNRFYKERWPFEVLDDELNSSNVTEDHDE